MHHPANVTATTETLLAHGGTVSEGIVSLRLLFGAQTWKSSLFLKVSDVACQNVGSVGWRQEIKPLVLLQLCFSSRQLINRSS